jgi:DNA-directed RNA polymerase specialized sigma24 family protein
MPGRSLPVSGRRENAEDDAALVKAARRDPSTFAALYRRYVTDVYRYHFSRVGNTADAEDLTGQTFVGALEGLPGYRERGNFASWLFTSAHNKAADYHRRRHTRHRSPSFRPNRRTRRPARGSPGCAQLPSWRLTGGCWI